MSKRTTSTSNLRAEQRAKQLATVAAALERAERVDKALGDKVDALGHVGSSIVDAFGPCPGRWERANANGWTVAGIRAFVLAYAEHCPSGELESAAAIAHEQIEWCEGYEIVQRYASLTGRELSDEPDLDIEALGRAARAKKLAQAERPFSNELAARTAI